MPANRFWLCGLAAVLDKPAPDRIMTILPWNLGGWGRPRPRRWCEFGRSASPTNASATPLSLLRRSWRLVTPRWTKAASPPPLVLLKAVPLTLRTTALPLLEHQANLKSCCPVKCILKWVGAVAPHGGANACPGLTTDLPQPALTTEHWLMALPSDRI